MLTNLVILHKVVQHLFAAKSHFILICSRRVFLNQVVFVIFLLPPSFDLV